MQAETTDARSAWQNRPRPPIGADYPSDWITLIHAFDEDSLRSTLITIACNPQIPAERFILEAYRKGHLADRARLVEKNRQDFHFNHISQRVEDDLNREFRRETEAYNAAFDVAEDIGEAIASVRDAVTVDSSYGTKCNALHAIMQIGRHILSAPDTLGYEVRKHFQGDSCLEAAIIDVITVMFEDEKMHLRGFEDQASNTVSELYELNDDAAGLCVFESLPDAIDLLCGVAESDEESDGGSEVDRLNEEQAGDCQ